MNNTCWFVSFFYLIIKFCLIINFYLKINFCLIINFFLKINLYLITYNKLIISLQKYL